MKDKLIEILSIQSESYNQFRVFSYLIRELKKLGCDYYTYNGCIYATKGQAAQYPCIVSHMDTVHDIVEDLTVIEIGGNLTGFNKVTMEQTGIGGDDKVGIFIALQCLENFDNIKAVFFRDEEVGCEGSGLPDIEFFNDCNFILQCDRQGKKDFITNAGGAQLSNKDFQNDISHILKRYGYACTTGMMTDVMALKEAGVLCAMANMSCGYYNPHQNNEFVNILDVINCLNMVNEIITTLQRPYVCKYNKPIYKTTYKQTYNWKDWSIDKFDDLDKNDMYCDCCDEWAPLEWVPEYNNEMCYKCRTQYVTDFLY